jgi:ribosome biogenesis protein NSA2
MELFRKRSGRRMDYEERKRKKESRAKHVIAKNAKYLRGIKAKLFAKKQYKEKVEMRKMIKAHEEKDATVKEKKTTDGAIPAYLMDRDEVNRTKILSNMVKQKRKEKAGKWHLPIEKVQPLSEAEMFKVIKTGKRKRKAYKRMINKVTFVSPSFTRRPPKFERYIRPTGLRFKKAHITHPELKTTFCLEILGVKKNPQSALYSTLGVITKGTVIEVNVSELGLVTQTGKIVWGKYAQVTNNPELDGCINGVLLV